MSDRGDEAIIRVDKDIIKFFVASSNSQIMIHRI